MTNLNETATTPVGISDVIGQWNVQFLDGASLPQADSLDPAFQSARLDSGFVILTSEQRFRLRLVYSYGAVGSGLRAGFVSAGRWRIGGDTVMFTDTLVSGNGLVASPGAVFAGPAISGRVRILLRGRAYDFYRPT